MTANHLGVCLRFRRRVLGVSQAALAELLGLSLAQLNDVEAGKARLSAPDLCKASRALAVPVAWFFDGLEPANDAAGRPQPAELEPEWRRRAEPDPASENPRSPGLARWMDWLRRGRDTQH